MGIVTLLALYFVIWWTVLFAILPIGMRSQIDEDDVILGTAHSAPARFSFARKALWTTLVSAIVLGLFYLVTEVWGVGPGSFPHIIPGT
ncbi:DUF1467 family protein [Aureimonas jatrophae]|jgi:predicted secreted protein|uniref:Predicted secreted protein n=1 Tax=Aureimonas jatrophae TaxID=1166073 RepID=A0A1H0MB44_9HYPH|nr:DUF1467 family protein [Aureimonas jatrophae]MBB3951142.1 putative secreted protein [Aureimonas jatrophae]SDO77679.1 Predicted secreted protein [Aureimonas jatrophae]